MPLSANNAIIKFRRGLASEWSNSSLILRKGEPGYETDTGKLKIGDGSNNWSNLPYLVSETQQVYNAAVEWSPNHTLADGTRYLAGDLVYYNGNLYRAKYDNESVHPTGNGEQSQLYWQLIGPGYRLNIDGRDIPNIPYPVTSVNGQTREVLLSANDVGAASFDDLSNAIAIVVDGAPEGLDTLKELASAINNDSNFSSTINSLLETKASINNPSFTGIVSGVTKSMVGLSNVDNTSDTNKPISSATQAALNLKANLSHTHVISDIIDFNSQLNTAVNSNLSTTLVAGNGIAIEYFSNDDSLVISTVNLSPVGHKHLLSDINNFSSGFSASSFSVASNVVSIKSQGITNSHLLNNNIKLGSTTMILGSSYTSISGVTMDGGTP